MANQQSENSLYKATGIKTDLTSRQKEKYELLGYKRLILDYHYSEFVPHTLVDANADEIIKAAEFLGIDSFLLYAKDQWGNAYYKTDIVHKHKNAPEDLFGDVSRGLKKKGIETIAYFTVNWDEGAVNAHPEWTVVSREGGRIKDGGPDESGPHAKWSFLCLNTGYREYVVEQIKDFVTHYDFAALFLDIILYWRGANECFCEGCQKKWKEKYGEEIPRDWTPNDAARYHDFITELFVDFHNEVRQVMDDAGRKDMWLTHNFGTYYQLDDYSVMEIDPYGRDWFRSGLYAKVYRARCNHGELELIGHRHNSNWDYTVKAIETLQWEAATAIAHDAAIMYVDQPNIKGDMEPIVYKHMRAAFETAEQLIPHVKGTTPYAEVAVLDAEKSMSIAPMEHRDQSGAHKILTELHIPYDFISDVYLTLEKLKRFRLLIVPNHRYLSDKTRAIIRQYVEEGGSLIFEHEAGCGDDTGFDAKEPAFGLVELLGSTNKLTEFVKPKFEIPDARLKLRHGFLKFKAPKDAEVLATWTPPCIDVTITRWVAHQPMPGLDTDEPAIIKGKFGKGQFIYWGFRIFKEYVHEDHQAQRKMVEHCINLLAPPKIRIEGPRVLEAVYAEKGNELRVFLINGITSRPSCQTPYPGDKGGFVFHVNIDEVIPLHDITLRCGGKTPKSATNMAGEKLDVKEGKIHLPKMGLYDVIAVKFQG